MNNENGNKILEPEVGSSYYAIHCDHHKYGENVPIHKVKCTGGTFYKSSGLIKPVLRFPNGVVASHSFYILFKTMEAAIQHLKEYYRNK